MKQIMRILLVLLFFFPEVATIRAADADAGYDHLINQAFLPAYFDQETFDSTWRIWPEPLKSKARAATPIERREMAFQRYGLTGRPEDPGKPLQYVVDSQGNWTLNCFSCHGGQVDGKIIPGLPNKDFEFATITDEIRLTKALLGKPLLKTDYSSLLFPLGNNRGTTNAVNFGVVLMALRDPDLNVDRSAGTPQMLHHDMDAPPWWNFRKKEMLYIDGFAPKGHRGLMQFMMVPSNGPNFFRENEEKFRDVFAYLSRLESPKYPGEIDQDLASQGKIVFESKCSECHGSYGDQPSYPERMVELADIGTDRVRFDALTAEHRQRYAESWFNHYNEQQAGLTRPTGYVAPPLDGIWASAPYLHNGSVPTLWHLFRPDQRPQIWHRSKRGYDHQRIGLNFEEVSEIPQGTTSVEKRRYFDTRKFGKSSSGHEYPASLTHSQKNALLEYLKTL